jgi:hypothetical protein
VEQAMRVRRPIPLLLSRELMEPGIFGIVRPVLIWPQQLSARLADEHIEAILAHELMHVRRRDNLAAAMHMAVEAAFWFHPLVWWMERRMVEERERACDEAVVEMGSKPGIYADSLLKACRFCVESPLTCVSGITGADLKKRIIRIVTNSVARNLDFRRKLLLLTVGLTTVAVPVVLGFCQTAMDEANWEKVAGGKQGSEVVSVKTNKSGSLQSGGDRQRSNVPLGRKDFYVFVNPLEGSDRDSASMVTAELMSHLVKHGIAVVGSVDNADAVLKCKGQIQTGTAEFGHTLYRIHAAIRLVDKEGNVLWEDDVSSSKYAQSALSSFSDNVAKSLEQAVSQKSTNNR